MLKHCSICSRLVLVHKLQITLLLYAGDVGVEWGMSVSLACLFTDVQPSDGREI